MGLAISYQVVVDRHGGKLSCESVVGEGTGFAIEIPKTQWQAGKVEERMVAGVC